MRTRSQRLLSMVLALSMLLTFLPVSAFADYTPPLPYEGSQTLDSNDASNTYIDSSNNKYNKYQYTLNADGTATLTKFTGTDAKVPKEVKKGTETYKVTAIGVEAFANSNLSFNPTLTSVNLPNTIQTIGDHAFYGCSSLHNITLYEGLTEVKAFAFFSTSLETIDWPKSLTIVGNVAFHNMTDFSQGNSSSNLKPIKTIIYHGTKAQWDEMAGTQEFLTRNPQLTTAELHYTPTVTFDVGEHGTAPDAQVVQYEGCAEKPNDPTANDYKFKYWFTRSEDGEEEEFDFTTKITKDTKLYAHWEEEQKKPDTENPGTQQPGTQQPGTQQPGNSGSSNQPNNPGNSGQPTDKPNTEQKPDDNKTDTDKPNKPNEPTTPSQKPEQTTPPEAPAVEEDDTAAIGYAAAAVTAAFVGWGAYRIGSEVYLKYLLPKDVLLPQNRIQLAELLWEDAGRPAPADAAPYADVDANDTDARQAARWAVENGLLTLPNAEKPEEFVPYRSVSYAKSARAWNKAQQLKENAAR